MTAILEIDLRAIAANWRLLDALHPAETAAVLKADGYGLGAAQAASVLAAAGCKTFFTAHLAEAAALRPLLPGARILALNGLSPHDPADFLANGITPVLGSLADIALWRNAARAQNRALPAFLHVETGMNRLALTSAELAALRDDPTLLHGIAVDTVLTHLLAADAPGDPENTRQLAEFHDAAAQFPGAKRSIANSPGAFLGPAFGLDLIRPGAALYGLNTSSAQPQLMHNVVTLRAPILQIHDIPIGGTVGYSGLWRAARPSRIATIGVGYADGYHRALSNKAVAYFDDTPVPLVGRVSMDLATFDVSDVPARPGDLLDLLGPKVSPDSLALAAGTNGYEILTSLGRRFQRRYIAA